MVRVSDGKVNEGAACWLGVLFSSDGTTDGEYAGKCGTRAAEPTGAWCGDRLPQSSLETHHSMNTEISGWRSMYSP